MLFKKPDSPQSGSDKGVYVTIEELMLIGKEAKGFSFLPSQNINSILAGPHASKLRGRGMDFEGLRNYVQGDSARNIDWKATQRTGKPYVRTYNEEKGRSVWLIVSQRISMFFGSTYRFKSVSAAHTAALALFRALDQGDRVAAVVYNDSEYKVFKPHKSDTHTTMILQEIVKQNRALNAEITNDNPHQLNKALEAVSALTKHDDLIVLIGDGSGIDAKSTQMISDISAHNDVIAIQINDPMEHEIKPSGFLLFSDTQDYLDINTSSQMFSSRYERVYQQNIQHLSEASNKRAIPIIKISTDEEALKQIQLQLGHAKSMQQQKVVL